MCYGENDGICLTKVAGLGILWVSESANTIREGYTIHEMQIDTTEKKYCHRVFLYSNTSFFIQSHISQIPNRFAA